MCMLLQVYMCVITSDHVEVLEFILRQTEKHSQGSNSRCMIRAF